MDGEQEAAAEKRLGLARKILEVWSKDEKFVPLAGGALALGAMGKDERVRALFSRPSSLYAVARAATAFSSLSAAEFEKRTAAMARLRCWQVWGKSGRVPKLLDMVKELHKGLAGVIA